MGIVFDIANLNDVQKLIIATRASKCALERIDNKEGCLIEILKEEINKEITHSLTVQSIENEKNKTFSNIIPLEDYLDNEWACIEH